MDKMQSGILEHFKAITDHNYKLKSDLIRRFCLYIKAETDS
jgi:hypothetical protein